MMLPSAAVPERGAKPNVPRVRRTVLKAVSALSSPLLPDDYLELINPLWSTRELRGKIEEIRKETEDAATVVIRPGYEWPGHEPGQYLRIGVDIDGVRHWRAYSLTSEPEREDGWISITVKAVETGTVSSYLVRHGRPGCIVGLGGVEGDFTLPQELPDKLLFISAGTGSAPIMSMLRSLDRGEMGDVVVLHSARHTDDVIFSCLRSSPRSFGPKLTSSARRGTRDRPTAPTSLAARPRSRLVRPLDFDVPDPEPCW